MPAPKIKMIGIGGSGCNAVSRMAKEKITGVDLIAVNTDAQALKNCIAEKKILIGEKITGGFGAGMDVKIGEEAAKESYSALEEAVSGAEMVFLASGFGGGTGSAVTPILGEIAKKSGALTIAVVTLPFSFEGAQRQKIAKQALNKLKGKVDSIICLHNDKLLNFARSKNLNIESAFWICDKVLREAVKGISSLVSSPGIINVDFSDIRGILENSSEAFFGQGSAKGERRAILAANLASQSPFLNFLAKDSQRILLNIAGRDDLTLLEVNTAATFIKKNFSPGTKIVFGVSEDQNLESGEMKITLIATI